MVKYVQEIEWEGVRLRVTYDCEVGRPEPGFPDGWVEPLSVDEIEVVDLEGVEANELIAGFDAQKAERVVE